MSKPVPDTAEFPKVRWRRAKDKDHSNVFVGRHELLGDLGFEQIPTPEAGAETPADERDKADVITGAPGVGKSTMLEEIRRRAHQQQIAALTIAVDNFESADEFNSHVSNALVAEDTLAKNGWEEPNSPPLRSTQIVHDARGFAAGSSSDGAVELIGSGVGLPGLGYAKRAARWLRKNILRTVADTPTQHLARWDQRFSSGWIMLIDEAQQFGSLVDPRLATKILRAMMSLQSRAAAGLSAGRAILAGLNDTEQVLDDLGVTRPNYHPLGPLSQPEIGELIRLHVELGERASDGKSVTAKDEWVATLTKRYWMWPHHAQVAAEMARLAAQHYPNSAGILDRIIVQADEGINDYYQQRVSSARKLIDGPVLARIMAAERMNQSTFSETDLLAILQEERDNPRNKHYKMCQHDNRTLMKGLLHSGLLTQMSDGRMEVSIPSLRSYCEHNLIVENSQTPHRPPDA